MQLDADTIRLSAHINESLSDTVSSVDHVRIILRHLLVLSYVDPEAIAMWRRLIHSNTLESYTRLFGKDRCPLSEALHRFLGSVKPSAVMTMLSAVMQAFDVISSHPLHARNVVVAKFLFTEVYGNPKKVTDGVAVSTIIDRVGILVEIAMAYGHRRTPLLIGLATPTKLSTPMAYKKALHENAFDPLVVAAITPVLQLDLIDWWSLQIYLDVFVMAWNPPERIEMGRQIRALGYSSPIRERSISSIFQNPVVDYRDLDDDELL